MPAQEVVSKISNKKNKIFSGVLWSLAEKLSAQLVSFIISVVLARILLPDEYGLVAMLMVFIVLADVFVNSGFSAALIQNKHANDTDFSTVFFCTQVLSILVYCFFFAIAPAIADFYQRPELVLLLRVFALKIPISAMNSVQHAYVARHMQFKKFFYSTSIGTIISGALGIALALNGWGVWSLIFQNISLTIIDTVVLLFTVKWHPRLLFSILAAKRLIGFGWKILVAEFSGAFFGQLRSLVIGKAYTSADLAFYDRGQQIPMLIANNMGNAVTAVLFPAMSNENDKIVDVKMMLKRSMQVMSFIIVPIMVGLAVCADALIPLLFTEKWSECVPYLQVLAIGYAFGTLGLVPLQALKAIGESSVVLKLEFIKKPVFLLLLFIGVSQGVMAIAITMLVYEIYGCLVNSFQLKKYLNYSWSEQLKDVGPSFMLAGVMGTIISFAHVDGSILVTLCLQVAIGIVVYIGLAALFKVRALRYLMQFVTRKEG